MARDCDSAADVRVPRKHFTIYRMAARKLHLFKQLSRAKLRNVGWHGPYTIHCVDYRSAQQGRGRVTHDVGTSRTTQSVLSPSIAMPRYAVDAIHRELGSIRGAHSPVRLQESIAVELPKQRRRPRKSNLHRTCFKELLSWDGIMLHEQDYGLVHQGSIKGGLPFDDLFRAEIVRPKRSMPVQVLLGFVVGPQIWVFDLPKYTFG